MLAPVNGSSGLQGPLRIETQRTKVARTGPQSSSALLRSLRIETLKIETELKRKDTHHGHHTRP